MSNENSVVIRQTYGPVGGLTGWRGRGELTRRQVLGVLRRAELDAGLAPSVKSNRRILGDVMATFTSRDVIKNQWVSPKKDRKTGKRTFAVRWGMALKAADVEVGDSVGSLKILIELRDGSDELVVMSEEGAPSRLTEIVGTICQEYRRLRDNEVYTAAQITTWLSELIRWHFHGCYYSSGYFIPKSKLEAASALFREMSRIWGENWTDPAVVNGQDTGGLGYLPLTSNKALARGIVAGFDAEVEEIESTLDREASNRRKDGRDDVSPKAAVRFLRAIQAVSERARAYREVCADSYGPLATRLDRLETRLRGIATDSDIRFALLDTSDSPEEDSRENWCRRTTRGADEALAARRAMHAARRAEAAEISPPILERPIELD